MEKIQLELTRDEISAVLSAIAVCSISRQAMGDDWAGVHHRLHGVRQYLDQAAWGAVRDWRLGR